MQQTNNQHKKEDSPFLKIVATVVLLLVVVSGAWSHFSGDNNGDSASNSTYSSTVSSNVRFRNANLLNEHYKKHGVEMGFSSAEAYESAARDVVNNSKALHKTEAEDGDDVYYLESTNEFVIVSTDGYIRTYFKPNDGLKYFNRQ